MQLYALIKKDFGLSDSEIDALDDEEYIDMAAQALYLREVEAENVRNGIIKAIADITTN